ncbi:glycogen synthase [bacterium]|nr:glycogen synthase [bacterium]
MRILFVTPELFPFAKTGGLADYSAALVLKMYELGHDVRVIMPRYRSVISHQAALTPTLAHQSITLMNTAFDFEVVQTDLQGKVPVYCVVNDGFFDRDELYHTRFGDYPDNAVRFIFFCRAVLESMKMLDFRPEIIHCNDWQTALIPVYLRSLYASDPFYKKASSMLTIHNLAYQGLFWHYDLKLTGLDWDYFTPDTLEYYGKINLLKGGILFSDLITTVSPGYAREICTRRHGFGLDGILRERKNTLVGVLNGIDTELWSPATDAYLPIQYDRDHLAGKVENKHLFLKEYRLKLRKGWPLVCLITRLETLKGLDIFLEASEKLMCLPLHCIVLGKGRFDYEEALLSLERKYPDTFRFLQVFDEALAHRLEAAADMILVPSLSEPCGLNTMYSLRYGTVPLVRKTGGQADIVRDTTTHGPEATGFIFTKPTGQALIQCLKRALSLYAKPQRWRQIMLNGMDLDFSWNKSARQYHDLYVQLSSTGRASERNNK